MKFTKETTREETTTDYALTKTTLYVNDNEIGNYQQYDKTFHFYDKRHFYIHTWHITPPMFADVKADTEQEAIEMILSVYDYNPEVDIIGEYIPRKTKFAEAINNMPIAQFIG